MDVEEKNILKIKETKEDGNNLYEFDIELLNQKLNEYKQKIDNNDYKFEDTILNLGLLAKKLMEENNEKYKAVGRYIYNQMYGHLEGENN